MHREDFEGTLGRYLPLGAFFLVYVSTCLFGAGFFLFRNEAFISLYEYFSGAVVPRLSNPERLTALTLLLGSPALLAAGFVLGTTRPLRTMLPRAVTLDARECAIYRRLVWVAFVISAAAALFVLYRHGALTRLGAWADYAAYVEARWYMFGELGFFDFANIYLILPLLAGWALALLGRPGQWWGVLAALILFGAPVIANGLLFQKRTVVLALLILGCVVGVRMLERNRRLGKIILAAGVGLATIAYFALVVLPSFDTASRTVKQAEELVRTAARSDPAPSDPAPAVSDARLRELARELDLTTDRTRQLVMYSLMAPLSRTSSAALFYPIVFPDQHPYYGLDLGQDVLGFGAMPDHGQVVWRHMNPGLPGSTTAPFQFVLYSQVGLSGALTGSLIVGFALGLGWSIAQFSFSVVARPVAAGCLVVFAIYIAMDGARDAVLSSYGVIWFLPVLGTIAAIHYIVRDSAVARSAGKQGKDALLGGPVSKQEL